MWLVLGLGPLLEVVHLVAGSSWWLALPLVPCLAFVLSAFVRGDGERALLWRCTAPATLWATFAWADGLWDPIAGPVWVLGGMTVAVLWWRRQSPRSRIVIEGGCRWPLPWRWAEFLWRRQAVSELGYALRVWEHAAAVSGIDGADLHRLDGFDDGSYQLRVELAHGATVKDIKVERLASALRYFHPIVLVSDPSRPWLVDIRTAPVPAAQVAEVEMAG